MYRRYTIHKDGDILVENLDASGKVLDPEPVPVEDRFPVEVVLLSGDDPDSKAQLLELLEMAYELELGDGPDGKPRQHKLNVVD